MVVVVQVEAHHLHLADNEVDQHTDDNRRCSLQEHCDLTGNTGLETAGSVEYNVVIIIPKY